MHPRTKILIGGVFVLGTAGWLMADGKATYPVVYKGIIPDTFSDSVDVVVEGRR